MKIVLFQLFLRLLVVNPVILDEQVRHHDLASEVYGKRIIISRMFVMIIVQRGATENK